MPESKVLCVGASLASMPHCLGIEALQKGMTLLTYRMHKSLADHYRDGEENRSVTGIERLGKYREYVYVCVCIFAWSS